MILRENEKVHFFALNCIKFGKKTLTSAKFTSFLVQFFYFLKLYMPEDKRAKFGVKRIKITVFNQGGSFYPPPNHLTSIKKPNQNRVKLHMFSFIIEYINHDYFEKIVFLARVNVNEHGIETV